MPLSSSNVDHYDVVPGPPHDLAEVSWAIDAVNVCTNAHVEYDVRIMIDDQWTVAGVGAPEFWVLYGPLRLKDLKLDESFSLGVWTYSAVGDFGIKDQWGDGPGEFHLGLSFHFVSQGTEAADMQFVDGLLRGSGHLQANYYDHK